MANNSILAQMAVRIVANTAEFSKALNSTQNQLKTFSGTVKTIGASLGVAFGAQQVFSGLQYAVSVISKFEASMSEVKAITGTTGKEFEALTKDALDLGAATKFTATEVSQLQVAYGRLGFTTKEILNATGATLALATATGEDLAKSADIAGSTVRAFGLDAKETIRVADVMASSFNKSALSLDNFGEAMKYVAPVAANAGISLEQTTALLGVLADAGIRGSQAGTSLRKIISDLGQGAAPILTKRLKELAASGLSGADAMDEVGRTAYASLLVLAKNTDKVDEATIAYKNATGEVQKMADIMSDNLQGDVVKLSSAFDGFVLSGRKSVTIMRSMVQSLTELFTVLSGGGTTGDKLKSNLETLAEQLSGRGSNSLTSLEGIKNLRRELGKPIDSVLVQSIIDKIGLSDEKAKKFRDTVAEINKASSFDEQVLNSFTNFAKGYDDISKAASDYNAKLRIKILLNKQDQLTFGKEGSKTSIEVVKGLVEEAKQLDKATQIVYEYAKSKEEASTKKIVPEEELRTVGFLQQKISDLNDSIKTMADPNGIRVAQGEIKKLQIELDALLGVAKKGLSERTLQKIADAFDSIGKNNFFDTVDDLESKIKNLNTAIGKSSDRGFIIDAQNDISKLQDQINHLLGNEDDKIQKKFAKFMEGFKLPDAGKQILSDLKQFTFDFSGAIIDLASAFGEFVADLSNGSGEIEPIGNRIKKVVGGLMQSVGGALIAFGSAKLALKFTTNPVTAIVAGAALVAAGAALSRSANNTKKFISGGSGGSDSGSNTSSRIDNYQSREQNIVINGGQPFQFVIDGDQLRAWQKKSNYVSGRKGG